jgi:hypothetical protein
VLKVQFILDQANGNGNNPVANQVNAPPVNDQAKGNDALHFV